MSATEHDREHALVFAEYRQALREYRRRPSEGLRDRLATRREMLQYSDRARRNLGGWPRYYLVSSGRLHADPVCRGLVGRNSDALVVLLAELSGETDAELVAQHGKPCRHCLRG